MDHFNDIQRQRGEPYVKPKSRTSAGALVWFELMDLRSVITCPACGEKEEEIMPTAALNVTKLERQMTLRQDRASFI